MPGVQVGKEWQENAVPVRPVPPILSHDARVNDARVSTVPVDDMRVDELAAAENQVPIPVQEGYAGLDNAASATDVHAYDIAGVGLAVGEEPDASVVPEAHLKESPAAPAEVVNPSVPEDVGTAANEVTQELLQ